MKLKSKSKLKFEGQTRLLSNPPEADCVELTLEKMKLLVRMWRKVEVEI